MIELNPERIEKILKEETVKTEELETILRCIYNRYMCLYERYYADIDALNDDMISEMRNNHEETASLVRYYYMDIPQDVCSGIKEFDSRYTDKLLGAQWHDFLAENYKNFKKENRDRNKSEETWKAEFTKKALSDFYEAMDYVFREGFGTGSKTIQDVAGGISKLLFGKE